jgi:hypothetical protein
VPHKVVSVAGNTITVANPATQAQAQFPVANAEYVIDEATFHRDLHGKTSYASAVDSFINNPGFISPGIPSKKNSVQFTTGLTYTLR